MTVAGPASSVICGKQENCTHRSGEARRAVSTKRMRFSKSASWGLRMMTSSAGQEGNDEKSPFSSAVSSSWLRLSPQSCLFVCSSLLSSPVGSSSSSSSSSSSLTLVLTNLDQLYPGETVHACEREATNSEDSNRSKEKKENGATKRRGGSMSVRTRGSKSFFRMNV